MKLKINKIQRIILGIGSICILLSGLFPSYELMIHRDNKNPITKNIGHYFVFSPPTEGDVMEKYFGRQIDLPNIDKINFNFRVVFPKYKLQVSAIILSTFGFILVFKDDT